MPNCLLPVPTPCRQQVCEGVEVTPYYAGHVLGAAMLHVRVGSESLVYTGRLTAVVDWQAAWLCRVSQLSSCTTGTQLMRAG